MSEKIIAIKNPKFSNAEGTAIDVIVLHGDYGSIPFTATPGDTEEIGREIYAAAMAGDFGEIAPYEPPVFVVPAQAQKDTLLKKAGAEIDALRDVVKYAGPKQNEQYAASLEEWERYRAAVYVATPEEAVKIPLPE